MIRQLSIALAGLLTFAGLFSGCKQPGISSDSQVAETQIEPQFQNESQFVLHSIVSDLAEQIYFAKFHRLPNPQQFSVIVTKVGGTIEIPEYELKIRLGSKISDLKLGLKINGPIWSPDVYRPIAEQLASAVKLRASVSDKSEDTELLSKLLDATAETIERQNQQVSKALENNFTNAQLHEKAALLLGAFVIREHSGSFFEIRSPLSRLTAHLAMAQLLRGSNSVGVNGQLAEAMMLTMIDNQQSAMDHLDKVNTNDVAVAGVVRALRARATGDYRPLTAVADRSPMENVEWFYAMADRIDLELAWPRLTGDQRQTIEFVRAAHDVNPTVGVGNDLTGKAIPLELQEIKSVFELTHPSQSMPSEIGKVLNVLPEHCFQADANEKIHVQVIGWGQWSMFFQRHLCHAVEAGFYSINQMLGDPEGAKEFAAQCDQSFGSLTLYTFVRRLDATEMNGYRKAVDDGFKLAAAMPQYIPAGCWNSLFAPVTFGPIYKANQEPGIDQWYNPNLLPGTAYDLVARLGQSSLTNRAGAMARLEALHELAPYHRQLSRFIVHAKYDGNPTYEQAMALYGKMLPYSPIVMRAVANNSLYGDIQRYEQLMAQAAELDPSYYYDLGQYEFQMNNFTREDKAAEYFQKGYDADPDRVGASQHAEWLVKYWLKHNRTAKAGEIAEEAGNVYSGAGLSALAIFQEATSNYDGAFQTLANFEERYNQSCPLLNFCLRYKAQTGDSRFEPEFKKRVGKLFPNGFEKASLEDFKGPPADGVAFRGDSALMFSSGLKMTDVIVAVYGVRVHNVAQYTFGRTLKDTPELDIIVWQGDAYHELKPSVPGHLFGVNIDDYNPYSQASR